MTVISQFNRLLRMDEKTVRRIATYDSCSERVRVARIMLRMLDSQKEDLDFRTAENNKVYPINKKTGEIANGPMKGIKVSERGESSEPSKAAASNRNAGRRKRTPKDITEEYKEKATPGVGKIIIEPGYNIPERKEEIKMAEWVHKTFGGDITLLKESTEENTESPDYKWHGAFWELKVLDAGTESAVKTSTRKALHQIAKNPGGVILDISKCGMDLADAKKSIENRINQSAQFDVDVMVIYNKGEYTVLRFT